MCARTHAGDDVDLRRWPAEATAPGTEGLSRPLKVIGVAGEQGTTTTSCLIASILTTAGHRIGILGSLGYSDGRRVGRAPASPWAPDRLARWLGRLVRNGCSHAVMEVSQQCLDSCQLAGLDFDVACVTGLGADRSDGDCRAPADRASPVWLLEHLAPEGLAVLNADDPASAALLGRREGPVLTVAMQSPAEITATILDRSVAEMTFLLVAGAEAMPVRTRMIGTRHVYACLAAAAVGLAHGLDLPSVARGLEAVDYVPGQLERIECGQAFAVFIDQARTPGALAACFEALREVVAGRILCVLGVGDEVPSAALLAETVEAAADLAILTTDHRAEAIARALAQARAGDAVLIAGNNYPTRRTAGRKRVRFDDGEVARSWLYREKGLGIRGQEDTPRTDQK
jgi:UDP-N-acetylmuramoyl-L-alanyl-D-glutamate--2,6-diaminopimelate ligase